VYLHPSTRNFIANFVVRILRFAYACRGLHRAQVLTWCAWEVFLTLTAFSSESVFPVAVWLLIRVPKSNCCVLIW